MAASHSAILGANHDLVKVERALISVSDKTGVVEFARQLVELGVEILSTGGTATTLRQAGLNVKDVSEVTGFPEILNGRVKTLHPSVHGALLSVRGNATHEEECKVHNIQNIDMVVVNLYPFSQTVAKGADFDTCVENIDIGGPTMIRAAAKNHRSIAVVVNPEKYEAVLAELRSNNSCTTYSLRRELASLAFTCTGVYDSEISHWFQQQV
eukprot:TRINITY_DN1557_c0_g1_i1.p1 TRINITY_DN1557_c0_g1~~TRINITY_DN1557_c0_g1_i1.p1  ORF type:complete len:211 (-),score=49.56 TRINITY_DN1557_c0_g1_i1:128-760(-)